MGARAGWPPGDLRRDPADERVLCIRYPEPHRLAEPLSPAPRWPPQLLDLRRRTGQEGLGHPDPCALQCAYAVERFVALLRLASIDAEDHGIHVGIRGRELSRLVLASGQPRLVALDGALDRIVRPADLVRLGSLRPDLPDRPGTGAAPMPQPTHHIPAQDPPGPGQGCFGFRTEGPGVGRAYTCGAMDQLTDDMHRAMEGAHATMTMSAHAEPASACLAPLLRNGSCEAAKNCIVRPTV